MFAIQQATLTNQTITSPEVTDSPPSPPTSLPSFTLHLHLTLRRTTSFPLPFPSSPYHPTAASSPQASLLTHPSFDFPLSLLLCGASSDRRVFDEEV
jgi:hypothetical protein